MMTMMRCPPPIGQAHQTQGTSMKVPNSESCHLPRKCGPKIRGPRNQNHAKHPIHCRMNGVSVMNLRRDQSTSRCVTSCSLQLWNWSSLSLKNVLSISPQYHICLLYGLWTNLLQAPRALTARPPAGSNRARTTSTTFGRRIQP